MADHSQWARRLVLSLALGSLAAFYLEVVRSTAGEPFSLPSLAFHWLFVLAIQLLFWFTSPRPEPGGYWVWTFTGGLLAGLAFLCAYFAITLFQSSFAWVALACFYTVLLGLDKILAVGSRSSRWVWRSLLSLAAGAIPVALAQVESNFAEEEFFSAVQVFVLAGFWLILWISLRPLQNLFPSLKGLALRGWQVEAKWLRFSTTLLSCAALGLGLRLYQLSFFPEEVQTFPGISQSQPFLCGEAAPDETEYSGNDVFQRLIDRVAANPSLGTEEYGMLALATAEDPWAELFRESILEEARMGLFTGPAHSVKYIQYEAALRAYYFPRMRQAFPGLFSGEHINLLQEWFSKINRRALTVEWVDWLYAAAFARWPSGPYMNQENGAGLLALLEVNLLGDQELSQKNRAFLEKYLGGWEVNFRNTDDAIFYQPEWMDNALFQLLYTGKAPQLNVRRSFEWHLLQVLPDGAPLSYNHPGAALWADTAYLGGLIFNEENHIWIAGRALDYLEAHHIPLNARPGIETPVDLVGRSPNVGTCLLYADSGLPTRSGPLAADKIVFRDGWGTDSTYLLVNLRFTGWHRYKATGGVVLLYHNGPILSEITEGESLTWLPEGRSLFRDKRIPRENLNGLVIGRSGWSRVVFELTGFGGPWAQDPPHYAVVESFDAGTDLDTASILIEGWRGWNHRRNLFFYHDGPVVIIDHAQGVVNQPVALIWHLTQGDSLEGGRVRFQAGDEIGEMVLVPLGEGEARLSKEPGNRDVAGLRVQFQEDQSGVISLATVFLFEEWVGSDLSLYQRDQKDILQITGKAGSLEMIIDP